jgi:hypothetical protein
MSYHPISIGKLSPTQISKILNSHPVRIKGGSVHNIEISTEQLKKFAKAHNLGKSYTISLDPFQIQNHQHLRGGKIGLNLAKTLSKVAGTAAEDAGARLTRSLEGSGAHGPRILPFYPPHITRGGKIGLNLAKTLSKVAGTAAEDAGARLTRSLEGSGVNRLKKGKRWLGFVQNNLGGQQVQDALMDTGSHMIRSFGGKINRLHKAKRWTGFVQNDLGGQQVQDALMDTGSHMIRSFGFGLKKRVVNRYPKKISGRALFNA